MRNGEKKFNDSLFYLVGGLESSGERILPNERCKQMMEKCVKRCHRIVMGLSFKIKL